MTAIKDFTPFSIVLVTGANGHVAQHVVSQLLSRPEATRPRVRATCRRQESADALATTFSSHVKAGTLEIILISDITKEGAFTDALSDVTHIAHVASPLVVAPKDTENDLLIPAIRGTTALLKAAANCPNLEAVVVTSSFAALFDLKQGSRKGYTYTGADWNPTTYAEAADPNLDLTHWPEKYRPFVTYCASKSLAEKAAWDFYRAAKPRWRLSTVLPASIGGPYLLPLPKGLKGISYNAGVIWNIARSKPEEKLQDLEFVHWVDVRDVAEAHVKVLITPEAEGKRLLAGPWRVPYSDVAGVIREKFGWKTSEDVQTLNHWDADMVETERTLNINWIGLEKMVVDTVEQLRAVEGV
ncbi:uncharacterized protein HMPREF1541_09535 [Cyphellophora europaea CBS 101466]|uniref:NAD-dependent epimerase/dehydratase domain-containing protein n=1 Tax=Cyphellophora europaea (strain CBS 101466) TaxID=1220924 RepID=W2SAH3_CYPE1|nr:uncharacterized protein HMPREF1541_09535 [Cyphellophora europaea CBS 101466]ETN45702.1 hypothetical protein HMPREF1541_09535 [Cyphellophora europaea CBS 101466]